MVISATLPEIKTMSAFNFQFGDRSVMFANRIKAHMWQKRKAEWYKNHFADWVLFVSFFSSSHFFSLSPFPSVHTHTHTERERRSMYLLQHCREDRLEPSPDLTAPPHLLRPDKPWRERLLQQERGGRILPTASTGGTKYQWNLPYN